MYRIPEEWASMIMSGKLRVEELEYCNVSGVRDIQNLKSYVSNKSYRDVVEWFKNDIKSVIRCDKDGSNGMHLAALKGYTEVLKYLLDKQGDPNSVVEGGDTPLNRAVYDQSIEAFTLLLDAGADINIPNSLISDIFRLDSKTADRFLLAVINDATAIISEADAYQFFIKAAIMKRDLSIDTHEICELNRDTFIQVLKSINEQEDELNKSACNELAKLLGWSISDCGDIASTTEPANDTSSFVNLQVPLSGDQDMDVEES